MTRPAQIASLIHVDGDPGEPPAGRFDDVPPPEAFYANFETRDWEKSLVTAPDEWFTEPPPKRVWLLRDLRRPTNPGFLPMGKVGQLIAEGGAGKTMALIQLAVAVSTGDDWLSTFRIVTPGKVLLFLGEEDAAEARRRSYDARRAANASVPSHGSIVVLPLAGVPCSLIAKGEFGELCETEFLLWAQSWAAANGPWALIIFDPLSRFAGLDAETDNAAATRFIQALEGVATRTGATVLVAHHTNKAARKNGASVDAASGRGSSALVDGVRWQISLASERPALRSEESLETLREVVTLTHTKTNYSRKAEPLLLRRADAFGGALVALSDDEADIVKRAKGRSAERMAKAEARENERLLREKKEDEAVQQAVGERPGIPKGDLLDRVRALAHCGQARASAAVARVGPSLVILPGPRDARLFYLQSDAPPAQGTLPLSEKEPPQ